MFFVLLCFFWDSTLTGLFLRWSDIKHWKTKWLKVNMNAFLWWKSVSAWKTLRIQDDGYKWITKLAVLLTVAKATQESEFVWGLMALLWQYSILFGHSISGLVLYVHFQKLSFAGVCNRSDSKDWLIALKVTRVSGEVDLSSVRNILYTVSTPASWNQVLREAKSVARWYVGRNEC